jgi:manganese/zinc/iron transport system substrate-binding protein
MEQAPFRGCRAAGQRPFRGAETVTDCTHRGSESPIRLVKELTVPRFDRLLILSTLIAGCGANGTNPGTRPATGADGKLAVLATTGMIADAARIVGGERVSVTALMGPGVDPHLYQPTTRDQVALRQAQIVFYNGLHLEGRMVEIFESLAQRKTVVAVSRDIPRERLLSWDDSAGMHDPHLWFDVSLWREVVKTIAAVYAEADPGHAEEYARRAADYTRELETLDDYCRKRVEELPETGRVLITSHDAFHYLGRAYGLEVVGLQGISTDSEAGLKAITDAIDLIRTRRIRAIFPETSVPHSAIERVARDSGAVLGEELYSDALGGVDGPAGTYAGMIRTNIDHIVDALKGGSAP